MASKFYDHVVRKTADLIPYANNSRTHSELQIQQIANSIKEFGFTNPVLIDENNNLIAGHGRLLGAELAGLDKVPCIVLSGLTETQKQAYIIADNKIALNAGWDEELLAQELNALAEAGYNVELTGFDHSELDELIKAADPTFTPPSSTKEIDVDAMELAHKCPKCGFEYDIKKT